MKLNVRTDFILILSCLLIAITDYFLEKKYQAVLSGETSYYRTQETPSASSFRVLTITPKRIIIHFSNNFTGEFKSFSGEYAYTTIDNTIHITSLDEDAYLQATSFTFYNIQGDCYLMEVTPSTLDDYSYFVLCKAILK